VGFALIPHSHPGQSISSPDLHNTLADFVSGILQGASRYLREFDERSAANSYSSEAEDTRVVLHQIQNHLQSLITWQAGPQNSPIPEVANQMTHAPKKDPRT
jgi:hypothetical protein